MVYFSSRGHSHNFEGIRRRVTGQHERWLDLIGGIYNDGADRSPRGQLTKEVLSASYEVDPVAPLMAFPARKLNLDYVKQEFCWYLRANRKDVSIAEMASIWKDIINPDGSINSNYGHYLFNPDSSPGYAHNMARVKLELERDQDSRRAAICILSNELLCSETKDYPCTAYLNWHIRDNYLVMHVHMRSQDAVFGLGNDAPAFSFVHQMMWCALRQKYPFLNLGWYCHTVDSLHLYERHFKMAERILEDKCDNLDIEGSIVPMMSGDISQVLELFEVAKTPDTLKAAAALVKEKGEDSKYTEFTRWLLTRDKESSLL